MKNIVYIDMQMISDWDFLEGLQSETQEKWAVKSFVSNEGRTSSLSNILRYIKYFYYSFVIFLNRNKYDKIICWQAFYGIIYAFYCSIFRVQKKNYVIIQNLVYKAKGDKRSFIGNLYFKWLKYTINSGYIDLFVSASLTNCKYCAQVFDADINKFRFVPFSTEDMSVMPIHDENLSKKDYVLSIGRSNRDWEWLIESFRDSNYNLIIVCDELRYQNIPPNVEILNNVWGDDTYKYIKYCKCMIIPILIGSIASGDTVLVQGLSFSKPIIINRPSCLADDYIKDNETGLIVNKDKKELRNAIETLYTNDDLCRSLSKNARTDYLSNYTLLQYGKNIGKYAK